MTVFTDKAEALAVGAHGDQKYGDKPYSSHLRDVALILRYHNYPERVVAAGWLHDSLEDTTLTVEIIEKELSLPVADLVEAVTDGPGANRRERKAVLYKKLQGNEMAIAVKLADRIANVISSIRNNSSLLNMYRSEQEAFSKALRGSCMLPNTLRLWATLDVLLID